MALSEYVNDNEETIKGFLKAVHKGLQFVKEATDEQLALALKGQFPAVNDDSIIASIKRYNACDVWVSDTTVNEAAFYRLQDIMIFADELNQKVDYSQIVITEFANEII